jgi:tryptophan synthase alpha chain
VPLLTPTTPLDRARKLLQLRPDLGRSHPFAQRFAYVVARLGVTGAGQATDLGPVEERLADLKAITGRPLAVGFGLNDAASLERVRAMGAVPVIGSALVGALAAGEGLPGFLASRMSAP